MEGKSQAKPPKIEKSSIEYLSDEKVVRLLFLSFRFSQGSPILQGQIFHWLHAQYPNYKINEDNFENTEELLSKNITKYLLSPKTAHAPQVSDVIETEVKRQTASFAQKINSNRNEEVELILESLADRIIIKDVEFTGRERDDKSKLHDSQLITYGWNRQSTGMPEYDEMFRQVKDFVEKELKKHEKKEPTFIDSDFLEQFMKIIEAQAKK